MGQIREATEKAIEAAGDKITDVDQGAVAVLLKVADALDHPDYPIVDGRLDNVSVSVYLKYCNDLGLTPMSRTPRPRLGRPPKGEAAETNDSSDRKPVGGVASRRQAVRALRSA